MRLRVLPFMLVCTLIILPIAQPSAAQTATTRPYYMGFTPFPYEVSWEAVTTVYDAIAHDADLIAHHFDNGVPWPEALAGEPYSPNIREDWDMRQDLTPPGHQVYVSITPINILRNGLAPYRGDEDDMPLPAPWDTYSFNHPDVKTAYLNYARDVIEYFQPDYLNLGIEVNGLMSNVPAQWPAYLELHQYVYTELKADYPDLPMFVSVIGLHLVGGYTEEDSVAQQAALHDILPYSDYLALSLYPYMTRYMADEVPTQMFDDLRGLTDKPMAVAETGYPAEPFDYVVNGIKVTFNGSPSKQAEYIALLLEAAQHYDFAFVINFVLRDYDALTEQMGGVAACDLCPLWQDTGLYDEAGNERPALALWREALALGAG